MSRIIPVAIAAGALGLLLALIESLLPRSGTRTAAKAAIGLLFLEWIAQEIAGIFR